MYRTPDPQGRLFSSENLYLDMVGPSTFYGVLALDGQHLFPDEQFASMYCEDNGRPCITPSLLAKALLLQMYDRCSDFEATQRAQFDIRWKVALCVELEDRPFGKTTLQEFRARLHLSEKAESLFRASIEETKRVGLLKNRKLTVALDTTPVLGRGAVKDTYNLVADGIRNVCRAVAEALELTPDSWASNNELSRYWTGSSLKGDAEIDWSSDPERRASCRNSIPPSPRHPGSGATPFPTSQPLRTCSTKGLPASPEGQTGLELWTARTTRAFWSELRPWRKPGPYLEVRSGLPSGGLPILPPRRDLGLLGLIGPRVGSGWGD